ncbi:prophage antirepressor [Opitutaceae bacterium TAV1]|nr:prophage antirepressor [Opitutaceae bacterium TAV1]
MRVCQKYSPVVADVCCCLNLRNLQAGTGQYLSKLLATERTLVKIKGSRGIGTTLISESGLYKLVLRAHRSNPKAAEFQDWVRKN